MKLDKINLWENLKQDKTSFFNLIIFVFLFIFTATGIVQIGKAIDLSFLKYHSLFIITAFIFNVLICMISFITVAYLILNVSKKEPVDKIKYVWVAVLTVILAFGICFGYYWHQCQNLKKTYDKDVFSKINISDYSDLDERNVSEDFSSPMLEDVFYASRISYQKHSDYNVDGEKTGINESVFVLKNTKVLSSYLYKKTIRQKNLLPSDNGEYMVSVNKNELMETSQLTLVYYQDGCLVVYEVETNTKEPIIDEEAVLELLKTELI